MLLMHERVGFEDRRPSPFSWRVRYALAHKGVEVVYSPTRFADVAKIRALSGQHMVPVLCDGDRVVHDSWSIVTYLEDRFPDHPSLFGGTAGRGLTRTLNRWADAILAPAIRRLIAADFPLVLDPGDRAYYRESREALFGCSLEAYCADRPHWQANLDSTIAPLEATLSEQPYLAGPEPMQADYIVFSVFQYARLGAREEVLRPGSAVHAWRERLIGRFDNLGNRFPGYPSNGS